MVEPTRKRRYDPLIISASVLLLIGIGTAAVYVVTEQRARERVATLSDEVITTERLLSAMKDVETGERGFVITGIDGYLDPYNVGRERLAINLAKLKQAGLVDGLPALIQAKLDVAARVVAMRRAGEPGSAERSILDGEDKATMDAVRTDVSSLQLMLRSQVRAAEKARKRAGVVGPGGRDRVVAAWHRQPGAVRLAPSPVRTAQPGAPGHQRGPVPHLRAEERIDHLADLRQGSVHPVAGGVDEFHRPGHRLPPGGRLAAGRARRRSRAGGGGLAGGHRDR